MRKMKSEQETKAENATAEVRVTRHEQRAHETFALRGTAKKLMEVQAVSFTKDGKLIHCGACFVRKITHQIARRLEGEWKTWRRAKGYQVEFARIVAMYPIDAPGKVQRFAI